VSALKEGSAADANLAATAKKALQTSSSFSADFMETVSTNAAIAALYFR
jgi:hypothetical protein